MRFCFLSHPYKKDQPAYGGRTSLPIKCIKSIANGDSSNVYEITIQNHWGTHIDAPNHFFPHGKKITDYPADFWFFSHPMIIDVPLKEKEILKNIDYNIIKNETDLLLLRSGWSRIRDEDKYCLSGPGIASEVARTLREKLLNLRAIGIDWISVSSYADRKSGRKTHRVLLDPDGPNNPVLIIEDMDIPLELDRLRSVIVLPLRVEGIDSAPCTIIGIIE